MDDAATHVDDALDGFLAGNPAVTELEGRRDQAIRVVLRSDWDSETTERVAIITGGGSGHEPAVSRSASRIPRAPRARGSRPDQPPLPLPRSLRSTWGLSGAAC